MKFSWVITAHREGRLLWRTIKSVVAACEKAIAFGDDTEIIITLDCADEQTRRTAYLARDRLRASIVERVSLVEVVARDLGAARNAGFAKAHGEWITFLDADDLTGDDWLCAAMRFIDQAPLGWRPRVLHREWVVNFGTQNHLVRQHHSFQIPRGRLMTENPWVSCVMAHHEVLEKVPYRTMMPGESFEDWAWNCDVLAAGYEHFIVPGQPVFVRRKPAAESLGQTMFAKHAAGPPNNLWTSTALVRNNVEEVPSDDDRGLPETAAKQWAYVHGIEPETWPQPLKVIEGEHRDLSGPYFKALEKWKGVEAVVLCGDLRRGGADKAALWHVRALREAGNKTLLVTTTKGASSSPVAHLVDMHLGDMCATPAETAVVLQRLLIQEPPRVLFCSQDPIGWHLLTDNAQAITNGTDVYVAIYTMDVDTDGHLVCYGFSALDKVHDHIKGAIFDSGWLAKKLGEQYAYDPSRLHVARHPVIDAYAARYNPFGTHPLRIHWSGRIAPQKRPEMAFEVCALIAKERLPIEVDICGDGQAPTAFDLLPGVRWCGPYDDPQQLAGEYDALLYTSRTDGASLTLLEAAAGGHAIIAPDTGATGIVEHGLPLTEDTPEALVAALRDLLDLSKLKEAQMAARKAAAGRTWEAFVASLPEGYLHERKVAQGEGTRGTPARATEPGSERPGSQTARHPV